MTELTLLNYRIEFIENRIKEIEFELTDKLVIDDLNNMDLSYDLIYDPDCIRIMKKLDDLKKDLDRIKERKKYLNISRNFLKFN